MRPLVSIIIPCWNAARWLGPAIESALAQTGPACEVLVVDDGSTDDSVAIARGFHPQGVTVLTQPNRGAAAARNTGLAAARGAFVQFLDADDVLAPDKVDRQLARLDRAGDDVLASGEWIRFVSVPGDRPPAPNANYRDTTGVEFLQTFFESFAMMQPGAWLAPRALLDRAGGWDESLTLNDDGEYFARVMLRSREIRFCPGAVVHYRSAQPGRLSGRRDARALASYFRSIESTVDQLLAADRSPRSVAAAAYAWKWAAFELHPGAPAMSRRAEARSRALGGSPRPFPAGPRFQRLARLVGWRLAKRLRPAA